jgi:DNA-binding transcriptional LysR family regulator
VRVRGTVLLTDPHYGAGLARAGAGIAYAFEPMVRAEIRARRLRWLMPQASIEKPGLFLYFPRGASEMPKLRAFIDAAKEVVKAGAKRIRRPRSSGAYARAE